MLITMPDLGMHAIWARQSTRQPGTMQQETIPFIQQKQDVSKLTKWLALDFEDETQPQSEQQQTCERTGNFQASENDPAISSTVFSSLQGTGTNNYSGGQSELSFASVDERHHSSIKDQLLGNKQQYWNINANPFRPAHTFHPKNVGIAMPPLQSQQQFPSMNSMGSTIAFNVPIVGQNYGNFQIQNDFNLRFSPFQPNAGFHEQFQQNFSTPADIQEGGDNVWQNPDAEYRQWQQYTGTAIWGDPPFEKGTEEGRRVIEPIQRWTEFSDDDCFDMFERVSKLEQEIAAKTNQQSATIGWGDIPAITSGTYGRIQSFQTPTFGTTNHHNPPVFDCPPNTQFGEQKMFGSGFGNGFGGGRIGRTNRNGRTNSTSKWASYGIGTQQFPIATATTTPSNESTMAMLGMGDGFERQIMPNGNGGNGAAAFFPITKPTENEEDFLATPMTMTTPPNVLLNLSTAAIFPPLLCSGPLYPVW